MDKYIIRYYTLVDGVWCLQFSSAEALEDALTSIKFIASQPNLIFDSMTRVVNGEA